jgi:hypothetical protein
MSTARALSAARFAGTPGCRGTELPSHDLDALFMALPKGFRVNAPNLSESLARQVKSQSGSRVSDPNLVWLSCFRSSTGGAKRSWPFNHENVHSW